MSSRRSNGNRRERLALVAGAILFALGFLVLAFSFGQEIRSEGGRTLSGTLDVGRSNHTLGFQEFSYAEVLWTDPACGVRFHFLTLLAFEDYSNGGVLPQSRLNCDTTAAIIQGTASHMILTNEREPGVNYTLQFRLFVITQPAAWLGVPAFLLLLVASFTVIVVLLRRALSRFETSSSLGREK